MKYPQAFAILFIVSSLYGQNLPVGNVEFARLTIELDGVTIPTGETREYFSEETIQLAEGDIAEALGSYHTAGISNGTNAQAALKFEGPYAYLQQSGYFVGPGFIRIQVNQQSLGDSVSISGFAYVPFAIIRSGSSVSAYSDQSGNLVIPENASGPVQIILEQSADMINWTNANPGTYDPGEGKRFFRLRAVITK